MTENLKLENLKLKLELYQVQGLLLQYRDKELQVLYADAKRELESMEADRADDSQNETSTGE